MRPISSKTIATLTLATALGLASTAPALGAEGGLRADAVPIPVERPDREAAVEREYVGAKVVSSDNRVSGEVEDIVVENGALRAVIGYGGLLGLGDARVSLPLSDLQMVAQGIARVRISDDQVRRLPRYEG